MFYFGIPNSPIYDAKLWHVPTSKLGTGETRKGNCLPEAHTHPSSLRDWSQAPDSVCQTIHPPCPNLQPLHLPCCPATLPEAGPEHTISASRDPALAVTTRTPAGFVHPPLSVTHVRARKHRRATWPGTGASPTPMVNSAWMAPFPGAGGSTGAAKTQAPSQQGTELRLDFSFC